MDLNDEIIYLLIKRGGGYIVEASLFRIVIIVVIITWPGEKPSQKKNSDITVLRASDSFKWVMFMQNFEHDVSFQPIKEQYQCFVVICLLF